MNTILYVGEHSRTYDVQWHEHAEWELVYCTGGEGTFQFENGTTMNYKAGEAVAIPPRERHCNFSSEGFTNIYLRMAEPSMPYRSAFRVSDDGAEHLRSAFAEARFYFLADVRKRELVLAALGELITSYMIVYRSNSEFSKPVEQIRAMIINNYAQCDFALDEAIRQMPFHYDYLRKLFKKEMGITPLEYMTGLRMKKAETMLTAMWGSDYSVAEIGTLCGYDDALYFSRVFKKHFGCSPSAFAKNREKNGTKTTQEEI
ncbi:MAG: helix-turn-helix transcriptional regulator [Oscillospiraceae bacterium]|nr:helix-turn-helix transcriptional regulator [Oscillospiraceae bacterium]